MKKIFTLKLLMCLAIGIAQPGFNPPFQIELERVNTPPMAGYHSFAFAQYNQYWLIIGGRTNGLHGINPNSSFAPEDANNNMVVIDTNTWITYTSTLSQLPYASADPLRSTNMQYYQDGKNLFLCGGYGRDSVLSKFVTFPVLTHIQVDSIIPAIINAQSIAPFIHQLSDTNFRICGGELNKLNNEYFLIFGHDFNGRYDQQAQSPLFTQKYSSSIRVFSIQYNNGNLISGLLGTRTDTTNFHRRDLNVFPAIDLNGNRILMAYGGVFRKDKDFPYLEPIRIQSAGDSVFTYQQWMHHYTSAGFSAYDTVNKINHTTFLGGMSFYDYHPQSNTFVNDTLVPFINDVTTFSYGPGNFIQENVHSGVMNALHGSNAKFIWREDLPMVSNEVLNLKKITQRRHIGYLLGGIWSDAPNNSPNTLANDTIWRVYMQPSATGIKNEHELKNFNLNVYPTPVKNEMTVTFSLEKEGVVEIRISNSLGSEVHSEKRKCISGPNQCVISVNNLKSGNYFIQIITDTGNTYSTFVIQQ